MRVKTKTKAKRLTKKSDKFLITRKRSCRFCRNKIKNIDYKDIKLLEAFITEKGKINSRRFSGNCARHQRVVAEAIKKARFISLLPYVRM